MAPSGTPAPPEARGREPPSFFFFLDLLPRWEKGFPSGPWPPWHGRGESPSEIGSVSLSLCLSLFLRSQILPFHRFLYSRRSVTPIGLKFQHDLYPDISFLAAKEGHQPPYGWPMRVRSAPPCLMATSGTVSRGFFFPKIIYIPKKISVSFYSVWTPFDMDIL